MTLCYLIYMNHALPTSIMIFRYVSPILAYLNQWPEFVFVMEHIHMCKKSVLAKLTLKLHKKD